MCAPANSMFPVPDACPDVAVDEKAWLALTVKSDQVQYGCPSCSVLAVGHGPSVHSVCDARFGRVTRTTMDGLS